MHLLTSVFTGKVRLCFSKNTTDCSYGTTNKMHLFLKLFILVKRSTCFRRSFRPSSGAQNCVYSNGICQTAAANCCCRGWDETQIIYFCKTLYMFWTVFPSIIRSWKLRIQQRYMSNRCCYLLLPGMRWNSWGASCWLYYGNVLRCTDLWILTLKSPN